MTDKNSSKNSTRRLLLLGIASMCSSSIAIAASPNAIAIQVWKDPNCGCCKDWIIHLEKNNFSLKVNDQGNNAARARLGMPQKFASCHTALVGGYVIEGHVPAEDIQRLLKEKPQALGLAVPGMPIGSPGMDGPVYGARRDAYQVLLIQKDSNQNCNFTIDHWCGSSLKQFFPSCHGSQQDEHVSNDAVFNRRRGQEN